VIVANVLIQLLEIFDRLHNFVLSGGVGTSDNIAVFLSYCTAGGMVGRHAVTMSSALRQAVWELKKCILSTEIQRTGKCYLIASTIKKET
jgi:hypothetical protein